MTNEIFIPVLTVLVPLAGLITYYDVRYRRIPNWSVLGVLLSGIVIQTVNGGWKGLFGALLGCVFAFGLMFIIYLFGGMGAGDVKLFGAIGALIGVGLVLPTFALIVITGGLLAVACTLWAGTLIQTMFGVWRIFTRLLPGGAAWRVPQVITARQTVPYGVAITIGSLLSMTMAFMRS